MVKYSVGSGVCPGRETFAHKLELRRVWHRLKIGEGKAENQNNMIVPGPPQSLRPSPQPPPPRADSLPLQPFYFHPQPAFPPTMCAQSCFFVSITGTLLNNTSVRCTLQDLTNPTTVSMRLVYL